MTARQVPVCAHVRTAPQPSPAFVRKTDELRAFVIDREVEAALIEALGEFARETPNAV